MGKKGKKRGRMVIEIGVMELPSGPSGGIDARAAASIGVGSWAVEFIRKHPEVLSGFHGWLDERHGGEPPAAGALPAERLAAVEKHLTLLGGLALGLGGLDLGESGGSEATIGANGSGGSAAG